MLPDPDNDSLLPETATGTHDYTPGHEEAIKHWLSGKKAYCARCNRPIDPKGVSTHQEYGIVTFRCPNCEQDYDWKVNADSGGLGAGNFETDRELQLTSAHSRPAATNKQDIIYSLEPGDEILINNRKKPMTVTKVDDKRDSNLSTSISVWLEGPRGGTMVLRFRDPSDGKPLSAELRRQNKASKTGWQHHEDLKYIVKQSALDTPNDFVPIDISSVSFESG